jgi:hypothetical protein
MDVLNEMLVMFQPRLVEKGLELRFESSPPSPQPSAWTRRAFARSSSTSPATPSNSPNAAGSR